MSCHSSRPFPFVWDCHNKIDHFPLIDSYIIFHFHFAHSFVWIHMYQYGMLRFSRFLLITKSSQFLLELLESVMADKSASKASDYHTFRRQFWNRILFLFLYMWLCCGVWWRYDLWHRDWDVLWHHRSRIYNEFFKQSSCNIH